MLRALWQELCRLVRLLVGAPAPPGPPVAPPLPLGRTVDLPGRGETFIRRLAGDGPAVVLLHGWTATADVNWFRLYDSLEGYDVVAVDQRGHGRGIRSTERFRLEDCADDVAALLRCLDTGPAVLVGYSMGGPVALEVARRHPQAVAGLVLAATALSWRDDLLDRLRWRSMRLFELVLRSRLAGRVAARGVRQAVAGVPEAARWERWLVAELLRGDPRALADAGRALGRHDARPWASEVAHVPTSVIVTARDGMVEPSRQRGLATALDARLVELPAGHEAPLRDGPALGEAVRGALDDLTSRRRASDRRGGGASGEPRSSRPAARR